MTGRRKRKGKPLGAIATAQRSWDHFQQHLATAQSPGHQVHAGCCYLGGVLERTDPQLAQMLAAEALTTLVELAQRGEQAAVASAVATYGKRNGVEERVPEWLKPALNGSRARRPACPCPCWGFRQLTGTVSGSRSGITLRNDMGGSR